MFFIDENGFLIKPKSQNSEKVSLPENTKVICDYAFDNWINLKEIYIPNSVTTIGAQAFNECSNLLSINLPGSLCLLNNESFSNCLSLQSIKIPAKVTSIPKSCFSNCQSLINVELSPYTVSINNSAFYNCKKLTNINIPNSVAIIGPSTFYNCQNLQHVSLPSNLTEISPNCFESCTSLENIVIPNNTKKICKEAFINCSSLKKISLPSSLVSIEEFAFHNCPSIEELSIKNLSNLAQIGLENCFKKLNYVYINSATKEILIVKEPLKRQKEKHFQQIFYEDIQQHLNCSKSAAILLACTLSIDEIKGKKLDFINPICEHIFRETNHLEILNSIKTNNKEYLTLYKKLSIPTYVKNGLLSENNIEVYNLFKLSYNLGAFSEDQIQRQKATEFIAVLFEKNILNMYNINDFVNDIRPNGYNNEWADFIMNKNNIDFLFAPYSKRISYIARSYNEFDSLKEFNRSNKGSQRYKKLTVETCKEYFSSSQFKDVQPFTQDIAQTLSHYTRKQETFDTAVEIRKEYISLEEIGAIREQIIDNINETIADLSKISEDKFSIEFLSKRDSRNYVLGKYCSCCAHLEAVGYGIVKASILHPDCQNLAIKDNEGKIIAKATIYVNRNQQYALLNTIKINEKVSDADKNLIYQSIIKAITTFAEEYNRQNPSLPLKRINVGTTANDLIQQLSAHAKISKTILKGIDFSLYGKDNLMHDGDWKSEQYIIYEETKKRK